ncbi:MAG: arabinan endo-1,5-alpha-L-arabinosidase [Ruminococcaceae bacterium]|nr:arabinan endo-1,5-alpha-L-arabinosidase [Oscillospiraceae bacterium]
MKNPVVTGWYADPESRVYNEKVYMYVTRSLPFEEQHNLDLVVTDDLENYEIIKGILDMDTYKGATHAIWAPTVIDKDGKYYIIFAANNIMTEDEVGGLYIGVSDIPEGPFKNVFEDGRPLLNKIYNRSQPIDAHLFKDEDGRIYLYYGGWGHMMVCRMNDTMNGFLPMEEPSFDGIARELTPEAYVEAPFVMKIDGKYALMYSSGSWSQGTYHVRTAYASDPCGPFEYYDTVLDSNELANGPGHNSAFTFKGKTYIAYHRRIPGDTYPHHRVLCVDELGISGGRYMPVQMT